MQTDDNQGIDRYRENIVESSGRGLSLLAVPALEAAADFQQSMQEIETSGPALIGPGFAGYFNVPALEEEVTDLEASQPETTEDNKKTTKKKKEVKYLSVTGYFNRAYKRELAQRLDRNNRKRRAVKTLLCTMCHMGYFGPNRCQCPARKPARKNQ